MEQLSKVLDTAIKAPLWFWFAIMLASGIPMFNISNLVGVGIGADFKLFGVPLALIALASTSLFLASACARSAGFVSTLILPLIDRFSLWISIKSLDVEARAILAVLEDDSLVCLHYQPDDGRITNLRDRDFLLAELVGRERNWATYRISSKYERQLRKYRGLVRRLLRVDSALIDTVRKRIAAAERAASRLV